MKNEEEAVGLGLRPIKLTDSIKKKALPIRNKVFVELASAQFVPSRVSFRLNKLMNLHF